MSGQGFTVALEQRRILAVTRVKEGYRQKDVAAFLGVHPGTVCAWVRAARQAGGLGTLHAKPKSGRPRKLSRRQERTVLGWVAKPPTHFGFANALWTTRRLAALIQQRWGVAFNANYLATWLRARGHSPQRPEQPALERDEAAIARLGGRGLAAPAKKAREAGAHLVLIDESGFLLNPLVRRTWARQGHTPVLPSWGRHRDKVSVIAALSVAPQRRRLGLCFHTDPKRYLDARAVAGFLRALLRRLRGELLVLWDGGSNHKGPLIRAVCRDFARLHLAALPAYAPELNPVESIWSHLKAGRMANFIPQNVRHLDQVVREHLRTLERSPRLLKALWKGSKLPFPPLHAT